MEIIMLSASIAALVSIVTTKILATHYFKIVDGYVKDIKRTPCQGQIILCVPFKAETSANNDLLLFGLLAALGCS